MTIVDYPGCSPVPARWKFGPIAREAAGHGLARSVTDFRVGRSRRRATGVLEKWSSEGVRAFDRIRLIRPPRDRFFVASLWRERDRTERGAGRLPAHAIGASYGAPRRL